VEKYYIREELDELLGHVDYLVSSLPATPATDNLLNR
jgi:phosphoglycerate dehydrogenase-like enzyme